MFDYCIIGGGPSGLYCASLLEKKYPSCSILILEKENVLGGRTRMDYWHNQWIVTGAGVGRWKQDTILKQLYRPSEYKETQLCPFSFKLVDILGIIKKLSSQYNRLLHSHLSFKDFFLQYYSDTELKQFCDNVGYTDYLNEHCEMVLYDYNFRESMNGFKFFKIQWNDFIQTLRPISSSTIIQTSSKMIGFECVPISSSDDFIFRIQYESTKQQHVKTTIECRKMIWAGHLDHFPISSVIKSIGSQPFLRYYVYLEKPSEKLSRKCVEYRSDFLQKIIPITDQIYMISYSDNERANISYLKTPSELEIYLDLDVKIIDVKKCYWKKGTHYYKPSIPNIDLFIQYAQNPKPNIYLIGELISKNQGWTEGALESVHSILHLL